MGLILYCGDLNTRHSVIGTIQIPEFIKVCSLPNGLYGHLNTGVLVRYSDALVNGLKKSANQMVSE